MVGIKTLLLAALITCCKSHPFPWEEDTSESDSNGAHGQRNGTLYGNAGGQGNAWGSTGGSAWWDGPVDMGHHHIFRNIHLPPINDQDADTYYIGAVETDWDYAPSGKNLVTDDQSAADAILGHADDRVGRVYKKVLYKRFTDLQFTEEIPNPPHMGFLGPLIKAQEGDVIVIYFKNLAYTANRNFSIHPHGVQYNKDAEGALYADSTSGADKDDDQVAPGDTYKYVWRVEQNYVPTREDSDCLAYVYHSHVDAPKDISTGLMGPLMVCKKHALGRMTNKRRDADRNYFAYFDVTDESESWLVEENLNKCGNPSLCQTLYNTRDSAFSNSNKFPAINGRVFGNLEGFEAYEGETVALNVVGLEQGIHGVQIYGQTFTHLERRYSTLGIYPATFVSAMMEARMPGRWLMLSKNSNEYPSMTAFFKTIGNNYYSSDDSFLFPHTRTYYLAAEEVIWNYGPSGRNNFEGGNLTAPGSSSFPYFERGPTRIGGEFKKARYFGYTDTTFSTRIPSSADMGILGPVIRGEVGETIKIVFKNMASRQFSFLPHGVKLSKSEEGAVYKNDPFSDVTSGKVANPGQTVTYTFSIPYYVSPTASDADCISTTYHSAVDPVKDIMTGLIGPLVICKNWALDRNGQQRRIDKEFHLLFTTFDERFSWYLSDNINNFTGTPAAVDKDDAAFKQSLRKHSINGRMFGNLDGLDMCIEDKVVWHVYGLGGFFDLHGVHFHGNTMNIHSLNRDAMVVIPGTSFTGVMDVDNEGSWAVVCRTNFHFMTGMKAIYNVHLCGHSSGHHDNRYLSRTQTREYFIAAEDVTWDYAPNKIDPITLRSLLDPDSNGYIYARNDSGFIGTEYQKMMFVEYTDATFNTRKVRDESESHMGILGPYIKAQVRDTIQVTLKNKVTVPVSIHPHGVLYASGANRSVDGHAIYTDTESAEPGESVTYTWEVPERAGPGNNQAKCASWPYYSFTDNSVKDTNSGLIGPLIICDRGVLRKDGSRRDVDRELVMLFSEIDENQSWLLDENIQLHAPTRTNKGDPEFRLSNKMDSINGYIYANVPDLSMYENQNVAWYIIGMGSSLDIHTVHFHGQTFVQQTNIESRNDVIEVFPSTSETVSMFTDNPGSWIIHCHFGPHIKGGMEAVYTILSCKNQDIYGRCAMSNNQLN